MIIISHRGNLNGPSPSTENHPKQIIEAIERGGFFVETDLWYQSGNYFLGHDHPEHQINIDFLLQHKESLYIHCKNIEALESMSRRTDLHHFWHNTDDHTITSNGVVWSYPGATAFRSKESGIQILTLPERESRSYMRSYIENFSGLCTDFPLDFRDVCHGE